MIEWDLIVNNAQCVYQLYRANNNNFFFFDLSIFTRRLLTMGLHG